MIIYTVVPPNTADLGTGEKATVFKNRRYWGGGRALLKRCKDVLLPEQNGPRLGDQFLKLAPLRNDKIKTELFH